VKNILLRKEKHTQMARAKKNIRVASYKLVKDIPKYVMVIADYVERFSC